MLIELKTPKLLTTPYYFSAAWDGNLNAQEVSGMAPLSETLSAATPKRISEFLAGRFCALKAIQAFQPDWSGQVGMNPDGSPRWPEGLVGSITHTQGFAAAAVAPSDTWLSVGIDSERMADEGILAAAKDIALRDDERRLSPHSPVSENEFILLIFSAKESISKCLYPLTLTKHPLEFADIILDGIDYQGRTFDFHLSKSIKPGILKSCIARGRFEFAYGCVHTGVELQRPVRRIKTGKCS
jgi:enterobactin synthetase component D